MFVIVGEIERRTFQGGREAQGGVGGVARISLELAVSVRGGPAEHRVRDRGGGGPLRSAQSTRRRGREESLSLRSGGQGEVEAWARAFRQTPSALGVEWGVYWMAL